METVAWTGLKCQGNGLHEIFVTKYERFSRIFWLLDFMEIDQFERFTTSTTELFANIVNEF